MLPIFSHFDVSHLLRSELKEEALLNMKLISVTFETSHLLRSSLKYFAYPNRYSKLVISDTSQSSRGTKEPRISKENHGISHWEPRVRKPCHDSPPSLRTLVIPTAALERVPHSPYVIVSNKGNGAMSSSNFYLRTKGL